jgi:hypothetical protein
MAAEPCARLPYQRMKSSSRPTAQPRPSRAGQAAATTVLRHQSACSGLKSSFALGRCASPVDCTECARGAASVMDSTPTRQAAAVGCLAGGLACSPATRRRHRPAAPPAVQQPPQRVPEPLEPRLARQLPPAPGKWPPRRPAPQQGYPLSSQSTLGRHVGVGGPTAALASRQLVRSLRMI